MEWNKGPQGKSESFCNRLLGKVLLNNSKTIIGLLPLLSGKTEMHGLKNNHEKLLAVCLSGKRCSGCARLFLPLSRSNVPGVGTLCQAHRRAPCSRSRSLPLPQSRRFGRWAPRRSPSPPRSPTGSQRLLGSYCPQTGRERTGPWSWLQPSDDLHTLWTEIDLDILPLTGFIVGAMRGKNDPCQLPLWVLLWRLPTCSVRGLKPFLLHRVIREKANEQLIAAGRDGRGLLAATEASHTRCFAISPIVDLNMIVGALQMGLHVHLIEGLGPKKICVSE